MTKVETTSTEIAWESQVGHGTTPALADTAPLGAFGAEFRELARQRRFIKGSDAAGMPASVTLDASPTAAPSPAPLMPIATPVAAAAPSPATGDAFARAFSAALPTQRISDDAPAMLAELSRMSDRLVATREELAGERMRADHAEQLLVDANSRLMAARVLVQDAQQTTRQSAERSAWLEGRCDTLQDALELAVNASILSRWKWRRQQRAAQLHEY